MESGVQAPGAGARQCPVPPDPLRSCLGSRTHGGAARCRGGPFLRCCGHTPITARGRRRRTGVSCAFGAAWWRESEGPTSAHGRLASVRRRLGARVCRYQGAGL